VPLRTLARDRAAPAPYLPVSDGKTGAGVSRSDDAQARSPAPAGATARETSGPPVTASGYVTTQIRDGILSGAFPLGSRLDQQVLADEMGVSTIPVREALRHLKRWAWCASTHDAARSSRNCPHVSLTRSHGSGCR